MHKNNAYIISVDLGTSSVRACLVDQSLHILQHFSVHTVLSTDANGKAEQNPQEVLQAALTCINEIIRGSEDAGIQPQAVCFSNTTGSLVYLDEDFQPLGPVLTYADLRSASESRALIDAFGHAYFEVNATPMHASYWLPKLIWLKNQGLDLTQCQYFCTLKDLLLYQITGRFVTDYSNAAATGMYNAATGDWDERLVNIAGIRINQLPEIHPTYHILDADRTKGDILKNWPPNLKIVVGAIDGVLSSLGAGAFKPGQVTTMIGSSGACRIAASTPLTGSATRQTWSYPLDDQTWIRGGAMNSGGLVTEWLVKNFSESRNTNPEAYGELFHSAAQVAAGAEGLIFLPYLFGERAPIFDEHARGVFFGLHSSHQRSHMARAGLEGILMALYSIYNIIQPDNDAEIEIRASGGYLQSELMLQIQADIFGKPILIPANFEGSIIGAAALALKSLGNIDSYDAISEEIRIEKEIHPDHQNHRVYQHKFEHFKTLYQQLKPLFDEISGIG